MGGRWCNANGMAIGIHLVYRYRKKQLHDVVCGCVCVGQKSALDAIPQELSMLSFRGGSWLGPRTCQLSQVGLWTPREQPPPLQHWPCRHRPAHSVFYVGTGNQTREASALSTELFLLCPCQGGFRCFLTPGSNATYLDFSLASLRWLLCSFTFALAVVEMLKQKLKTEKTTDSEKGG